MPDTYKEKSRAARLLLYAAEPSPGRELLLACKEARDAAPDAVHARQWDRVIAALGEGHAFKHSTFPAVISTTDPLEAELVLAIEEIYR